ncbi:NUDIX domain-containing protein [Ectothiorhodospira mobilis]|uniref:NUDIX domain-containing protein n=1 Tax=Ectothiorhodospira mobilis TaxID=195064 RepID=UPI00190891DC|nr:NUDIX hydrolase [Ectothiorhodospira mobilis]MBK1692650.1 NUDIX hydrolase [Ectothiorhodospira mobilis]
MGVPVTPLLAADVIIRPEAAPDQVLLIQRRNPPHGWALPGGFVDQGERVEVAALREAREETGLEVSLQALLGCYSDPGRDPRGHTVSAVYLATARGEPRAADDARDARWVDPAAPGVPLAFDHALILGDYLHYCATGEVAPLRF